MRFLLWLLLIFSAGSAQAALDLPQALSQTSAAGLSPSADLEIAAPPELPQGLSASAETPLPDLNELLNQNLDHSAWRDANLDSHPSWWFAAALLPELAGAVLTQQAQSWQKTAGWALAIACPLTINWLAWKNPGPVPPARLQALKPEEIPRYSEKYLETIRRNRLRGAFTGATFLPALYFWYSVSSVGSFRPQK